MEASIHLDKLNSKDPKVKYGYAKELLQLGATQPELLYRYFDDFVKLIHGNNNILKWTGIDLIGYLSAVDDENKTDLLFGKLLELLHCGHMITCNHAIFALAKIAENKPERCKEVIDQFLKIQKDKFDTLECRNIAIGKVIEAMKPFISELKKNKKVIRFIEAACENERNATKKKAIRLLKGLEK